MGRRYSRVSNYSIGRTVRALVFFVVGAWLASIILPRTGLVHSQQEVLIVALIVGFVMASFAKKYT